MKVSELFSYVDIMGRLAQYNGFDLGTAYVIAQNVQELRLPYQMAEQKRNELLEFYGEKDENGNVITNDGGMVHIVNQQAFSVDWGNFNNTDIDVTIKPLKLSKLIQSGVQLTVSEILSLGDTIINDMEE